MSSYHSSFTYLGKNSMEDYGLIITHLDNYDNGEVDSFLSLDPVYRDSYRGTKRTLYGTKYNSVILLNITVINMDKSEFTPEQTRSVNRWLTGSQQYTWMDLYQGEEAQYRLHCYVKDVKPYKMDSRIIGFNIYIESSSPWCYSQPQKETIQIAGTTTFELQCETDDVYSYVPLRAIFKKSTAATVSGNGDVITVNSASLVYDEPQDVVKLTDGEVIYNPSTGYITIENNALKIINKSISNETTIVNNLLGGEIVTLTENMTIQSDNNNRIFGDDFNYTWPRMRHGVNEFEVSGDGDLTFEYIVPIKVVDCVDKYVDNNCE